MVELDRKAANRESHERRRRLAGARPQAASRSRTKPWKTEGISRASWYRRGASALQAETTSSATNKGHVTKARETVSSPRGEMSPHREQLEETGVSLIDLPPPEDLPDYLVAVTFTRSGIWRDERAVVDIRRHPSPRAAITALVGPLSFCCHPHIERKPS